MNAWLRELNFLEAGLAGSSLWLRLSTLLCCATILASLLAALEHGFLASGARRASALRARTFEWVTVAALVASFLLTLASVWVRGIEVNHFPSQTMSEVLVMFTLALLASMAVLHFALGLRDFGPGWAILGDALVVLVSLGAWATRVHVSTLSTAQRDLPPALQSYWFPPHLSALIFSYATLGIAGAICAVYFAVRFWSGVFSGGRRVRTQVLTFVGLVLLPFVHFVTLPLILAVGVVFAVLKVTRLLPRREAVASMERTLDEVSYRAFSVGMPFLTAGLFMGAFWAQEAWANYWGWDSKENSALITWLVYVLYIHLRWLGGMRGEKAMAVLMGGALSVFMTFQVFGYLPDSQKSLHRYTDDSVVPREGQQGAAATDESARLERDG
jgi:cytochrome c-type biogenesis protein CcsB